MANKMTIIGAGAWGLTIAKLAAEKGHDVTIWGHNQDTVDQINNTHTSPRLEGIALNDSIYATNNLKEGLSGVQIICVALPSAHLNVLDSIDIEIQPDVPILSLCKGVLTYGNGFFVSDYLQKIFSENPLAVLSGPNIAQEIAAGKPAASVLACKESTVAQFLQESLSSQTFRIYRSDDFVGVESGGVFKNIVAIAAGICDGLKYGDNAKAALITRGLSEIQRVAQSFGAKPDTLTGLSGLGDMMTTCLSPISRNRSFGQDLAIGGIQGVLDNLDGKTVEGMRTIKILVQEHPEKVKDCPIMMAVNDVIFNTLDPAKAVQQLMARDLKTEQ